MALGTTEHVSITTLCLLGKNPAAGGPASNLLFQCECSAHCAPLLRISLLHCLLHCLLHLLSLLAPALEGRALLGSQPWAA